MLGMLGGRCRSLRARRRGPAGCCRVPFASDTRFWKAAAGLKNMCENLDHGIDPNSTVVAMRYSARNTVAQAGVARRLHARPDQAEASCSATSETMNRSARTKRNGELPSAATSTRMKNQNQ